MEYLAIGDASFDTVTDDPDSGNENDDGDVD